MYFPLWLAFQCARHRKNAVILYRLAALGDVVCTLPLCGEIRKRHPDRLLVYVTFGGYKKMVLLSRAIDCVYGVSWSYGTPWNYPGHLFGLVEKVYLPQTTEERSPNVGGQAHLVDELAVSCGLIIPDLSRQPRFFLPPGLIEIFQTKHELAGAVSAKKIIIGINCGRTWPVRMWDVTKWQTLVDKIHADYDAVILQFGLTQGNQDEFEHLRGVKLLVNRLQSDELVALIAGCDLLVSIDSGPVHIAGAVGTPVVGLFGAVNPRHRLPPDSPSSAVFSDVPCLFCQHATPVGHWKDGCPNNIGCMKKLEVEPVFQAVKSMLSNRRNMGSPASP